MMPNELRRRHSQASLASTRRGRQGNHYHPPRLHTGCVRHGDGCRSAASTTGSRCWCPDRVAESCRVGGLAVVPPGHVWDMRTRPRQGAWLPSLLCARLRSWRPPAVARQVLRLTRHRQ